MILKKVYDGETGLLITSISYMTVFILKLNFEISLGLGLRKKKYSTIPPDPKCFQLGF